MIWEKAEELGRLIGQTPECKELRRAESRLREDAETVKKLEAIQRLARQVDEHIAQGKMPDESLTSSYETAVRELETSAIGQAYVVARANFDKIMVRINQLIGQGIEKGATSSIITLG